MAHGLGRPQIGVTETLEAFDGGTLAVQRSIEGDGDSETACRHGASLAVRPGPAKRRGLGLRPRRSVSVPAHYVSLWAQRIRMEGTAMDLQGKAAIITGGGTGVGRACALALAERGCDVAVNYSRSADAAAETVAEVEALGARGLAVQGDVADDADCRRMVEEAAEAFGRLDVLINSAGTTVFVPHHDLEGITSDDWHRLYSVNTMGPFQMMRAAAPHLKADGGGHVVSISSVSGVAGVGSSLPYCASKAALNNLTVTMARVLAPEVRVNAVAPGFIDTDMTKVLTEDQRSLMLSQIPLARLGEPEEIAAVVAFLASDAGAYITGETIHVNGGMYV